MTENHRKEPTSHEVVDAEGKVVIKLDIFLKGLVQKLMGAALDNGRLAINTDRQFDQFQKSTKDTFYEMSKNAVKYLAAHGVILNANQSDEPQEVDK